MATYDERREARQDRLDSRVDRLTAERDARMNAAHAIAERIPFGQPILVGHHSERHHRADIARIDNNMRKACELSEAIRDVPAEATTAILASDSDATELLAGRIADAEANQSRMKAANVCIRKQDRAGLSALGFGDADIARLFTPDFCGRVGYPTFELTNNNANIRRMKDRLEYLTKAKARPSTEREENGVRIVEDTEVMRLRLYFPGKPAPDVIANLKSSGFRWAPSEGAWQMNLHNRARWLAGEIVKKPAV